MTEPNPTYSVMKLGRNPTYSTYRFGVWYKFENTNQFPGARWFIVNTPVDDTFRVVSFDGKFLRTPAGHIVPVGYVTHFMFVELPANE